MSRVAVIGLGTMGLPMARHLVAAGNDVVGCDLDPGHVEALGAGGAETPGEAAAAADAVLLSLPSAEAVEDVVLGERGVRSAARPGTLLVDMSTSPPSLARRLAAECPELDVLDAPVSGGPRGAADASLTIMAGGTEDAFERARPLFEALGRLVVLVGGHGAGQAAKLCNNLIAGATMAPSRSPARSPSGRGSTRKRSTSSSPPRPATRVSSARAFRFPASTTRIRPRTASRPSSPST